MRKLACVIAMGVLTGSACRSNPYYCEDGPDRRCGGADAAPACGVMECAAPTPVCDIAGSMTCVECTPEQSGACAGARPVCGADRACRGCVAHAECRSEVCLPDGSCADGTDVAYVDPMSTNNAICTAALPCQMVAWALFTGRPYLKLTGNIDEPVVIEDRDLTILAEPGTILRRTTFGVVLEVRGASRVAIYDLEIGSAVNNGGMGIWMPAGGAPEVTLERATVSSNHGAGIVASAGKLIARRSRILHNTGGGIAISGAQIDLENNVIAWNGSDSTMFGGILVSQIVTGMHRLEFNTIAMNRGASGVVTGVQCSMVGKPTRFSNNIIYGNQVSGGGRQVGGTNCEWTYSDIGPEAIGGLGNHSADPWFVNPYLDDFHLRPGSLMIDRADPEATLDVDLDGEARPKGARRDMGADERGP